MSKIIFHILKIISNTLNWPCFILIGNFQWPTAPGGPTRSHTTSAMREVHTTARWTQWSRQAAGTRYPCGATKKKGPKHVENI